MVDSEEARNRQKLIYSGEKERGALHCRRWFENGTQVRKTVRRVLLYDDLMTIGEGEERVEYQFQLQI
jgi:hypothetical protein